LLIIARLESRTYGLQICQRADIREGFLPVLVVLRK
jgi:hypothetical protein